MYCKNCGAYVDDRATFCGQCGSSVTPENGAMNTPSYEQTYTAPAAPACSAPVYTAPAAPAAEDPQTAQSILIKGILGLALSEVPVAGIILSKQCGDLVKDYLARGYTLSGKSRTGSILGKIGLPLSIVSTICWGLIIVIYFFIFVAALASAM